MNIIIAPDSFKESLTCAQAACAIKDGILRVFPNARTKTVLMADGGEGTAQVLCSILGGTERRLRITGPLGLEISSGYVLCGNGAAVIETASAAGLDLIPPEQRSAMDTTTYGVGQLIASALDHGCRELTIGLGGSSTNDCGIGMARALGARFLNAQGSELPGRGRDLEQIQSVDLSGLDQRLRGCRIYALCDVTNPLLGPNGSAAVFGPQKGAGPDDIASLERGAENLAFLMQGISGRNAAAFSGAGAAGGLGFGLAAFCGAELVCGADTILNLQNFDSLITAADLVVTGEGRLDRTSSMGKVISALSRRCRSAGVPLIALAGSISGGVNDSLCNAAESCVCSFIDPDEAIGNASALLTDAAERAFRLISLGKNLSDNVWK